MPEISALAKKVKAYRESLGETQFELSGEIGISIEELSLIERGEWLSLFAIPSA